ncbi:sodium/proton antiporter, NhaA family [Microbulbifer donghaiensis]|uniref:Na(+)/H(+) antiporter NhaA n=1 Tax=Microbulbifer donghaiensis TaxID=494016 RepID=A0A1M5FR13_9GAMM|nr:Na+/H+ antiporter NhaA [Microbulbifer donghaiensis]SHF93602.1 sodium/proton antiporter, NhaA family [Microbulbifer donghaiensis]
MPGPDTGFIRRFFQLESAGGILLILAAALALLMANSPLEHIYALLLQTPMEISVGDFSIDKPLLLWINDGLMAVFFFLIGLELKRELIEGELSQRSQVILPGLGAIGGMIVPALIYVAFNWDDPEALKGWAIPAATDIAFALGVLSLLGSRVPRSAKVFLTSLAIFDDIGAILIIAFFYTDNISMFALSMATGCVLVLSIMKVAGVEHRRAYFAVGMVMWASLLKSGVHATLAGVVLAFFIPMYTRRDPEFSPLKKLERDLHPTVTYLILPLFAFANAGVDFASADERYFLHDVPLGIALGLFVGNQVGIFSLCWLGVRLGLVKLPKGMSWLVMYGVAVICGIGFTMSLFIGSLAFEETGVDRFFDERVGILIGSILSGVVGYGVLRFALRQPAGPPSGAADSG